MTIANCTGCGQLTGPSSNSSSTEPHCSTTLLYTRWDALSRKVGLCQWGPQGTIVAKLSVEEGDLVKTGDALATLDTFEEMLAAKELALTRLEDATTQRRIESQIGDTAIASAELDLTYTQDVLELKIQSQEALVSRLEAEYQQSQRDLDRAEVLRGGDVIATSEFEDLKLSHHAAQETLKQNQTLLRQFQRDRELKLEMSRATIEQRTAEKERREVLLGVNALSKALATAEAHLERAIVRAPIDGRILKVLVHKGERVGDKPILKLGNTDSMFVIAEVYETDVGNIRTGQRATITSRAFSAKLTGAVERVGLLVAKNEFLSVDPISDVDARIVEVRIRLHDNGLARNIATTKSMSSLRSKRKVGEHFPRMAKCGSSQS